MHEPRRYCRETGCPTLLMDLSRSGFCADHDKSAYERKRVRTSDGRHTNRLKLTDDQVVEARRMRAAFKTQREIAKHFGVAVSTIQVYLRTGRGRAS